MVRNMEEKQNTAPAWKKQDTEAITTKTAKKPTMRQVYPARKIRKTGKTGKRNIAAGYLLSIKDIARSFGIIIISFCAVFVCTLFLNFNTDLKNIEPQISQPDIRKFYDAQVMTGNMVSILSGGCLLLTSAVMLCFYIGHYVDTHKKTLGILKAMGYPNFKIAAHFAGFGASVLIGTGAGFALAHVIMPQFYRTQNADNILPEIQIHFHPALFVCLILLPTAAFCLLSVLYGYFRLKTPVLDLLKGKTSIKIKTPKNKREQRSPQTELSFLQELKKATLRQKKSLVFFIGFASFCYAAMMQMSFGMDKLASRMMALMIFMIGVVLAFVTLYIATTSAVKANQKTLALMRALGYPDRECSHSILGCYRLPAGIGFLLGTIYQYVLLKIAVGIVFAEIDTVPEFHFRVPAFLVTSISFIILYELILFVYARKIKQMPIREVMMDAE